MIHQKRRQELLRKLERNAIVIVSTNSEQKRNGDVNYPFRPDSNFWYLTGFTEPDAVAVISKDNYAIFLRPKDQKKEIWDGERLGIEIAPEELLANKAYPIESFFDEIKILINKDKIVYFDDSSTNIINKSIISSLNSSFEPLKPYLSEMRLLKDQDEINKMQLSAQYSAETHMMVMKTVKPGMYEYQVAAIFDSEFTRRNSRHAYPPIVAGGNNACVLHYIENNKKLNDGDLLLVDAGCEISGYASDVTRTFPINGSFNDAQREIYEIVLNAQKSAINCIKPGEKVNRPHEIACDIISKGLTKLGIIKDSSGLRDYYMHNTGHWLGLDVHDVGEYKTDDDYRCFEECMVMTVEPGIYIRKNDKIDSKYWGIGVRIEDDILVTADGYKILSNSVVKEIEDIEHIMN
ncbi:MAG: aminopeptidase P N-terminal domain-containing protein [Candidatus Thioglobus sp.]|jgi:Xaa-Pro aminopeptidase|nr:aminopeptidase P N-terminal domain-containing protein [Candidatus Thioglobus sp.]